jgi:hypothetical protein
MSRSCYSDDYGDDFPGQIDLFRANVGRSIRSKAGQARLRELRDAMLRLPEKALQADIFAEGERGNPRVCALGAWALEKQGGDPAAAKAMVNEPNPDDHDTAAALAPHGWPRLVVMEAVYINDEGGWRRNAETPEQRYMRVLSWVEENISRKANGARS